MATERSYRVVLERNERGGFTVTVPALPAVATEGETRDEALANAADAIRLYLESLRGRGLSPFCWPDGRTGGRTNSWADEKPA